MIFLSRRYICGEHVRGFRVHLLRNLRHTAKPLNFSVTTVRCGHLLSCQLAHLSHHRIATILCTARSVPSECVELCRRRWRMELNLLPGVKRTRSDYNATHPLWHYVLEGPHWIHSCYLGRGPLHTSARLPLSSSLGRPVVHSSIDTGGQRIGWHRSVGLGTLWFGHEVMHGPWCRSTNTAVCTPACANSGLVSKPLCSV